MGKPLPEDGDVETVDITENEVHELDEVRLIEEASVAEEE